VPSAKKKIELLQPRSIRSRIGSPWSRPRDPSGRLKHVSHPGHPPSRRWVCLFNLLPARALGWSIPTRFRDVRGGGVVGDERRRSAPDPDCASRCTTTTRAPAMPRSAGTMLGVRGSGELRLAGDADFWNQRASHRVRPVKFQREHRAEVRSTITLPRAAGIPRPREREDVGMVPLPVRQLSRAIEARATPARSGIGPAREELLVDSETCGPGPDGAGLLVLESLCALLAASQAPIIRWPADARRRKESKRSGQAGIVGMPPCQPRLDACIGQERRALEPVDALALELTWVTRSSQDLAGAAFTPARRASRAQASRQRRIEPAYRWKPAASRPAERRAHERACILALRARAPPRAAA